MHAQHVKVELGTRSYRIHVGQGVLNPKSLACLKGGTGLLVTDSNVDRHLSRNAIRILAACGASIHTAVVPAGEKSKDMRVVTGLCERAAALGLDRSAFIVAFGGGMVGDLAGFVAAVYLRGVRLIQIPTTTLAMVDSSVGGKTGVNLPQGKNLVGSFHQPVVVCADLDLLRTLPQREYISGFAEVIKYGMIRDERLFSLLERKAKSLVAREPQVLAKVIARCCAIKADVVGHDERETGMRAILNYGHTLAHAVENVAGYGRWLHGEAVSIGMDYALELSARACGLSESSVARSRNLIRAFGLPCCADIPAAAGSWSAVRKAMETDKKSVGRVPRFVLISAIGKTVVGAQLPEVLLREAWNVCRK